MIDFLTTVNTNFITLIEGFKKEDYLKLDLSIHNKSLQKIDFTSAEKMEKYIENKLQSQSKKIGYGGYLEHRDLYSRSTYFNESEEEKRNIHIGLDIWSKAGSKVVTPLAGKVHSFKNNLNFGDYGPTLILEHCIENTTFYTLYGHLSLASITNLKKGKEFKKGEVIATLGTSKVNGDYAPHLHFQIIFDLQGNKGDYPGVSSNGKLNFYAKNCPDPNLLLNID
ncbi:Peptidase family M23 [Mesonia phycicola]|uniref:Peptidase family M23 n=1 Tax=Mesonia phycicola TaxID=579105 RepID=A0A1M6APF8_9FLAO|nr:peptidoglycan DD-metalloendopeptidase family protein [Mesonia phycicola]SHI38287.1 Peptidase family M23 [Mesonia phycicola]